MQFENLWLSRYPRPLCCLHDCRIKFIGAAFQRILQRFGIKDVPISVRNPQANAICEQLHQLVGNALQVFLSQESPFNVNNVAELIDSALATSLHAARSTIHQTLEMTPGGIIFSRDMFLKIPLLTDFQILQERRQIVIDDNL
jgi:transposase InsO family protein